MSIEVKKISEYVWEIPKRGDMLVPGRIYADRETIEPLIREIETKKTGAFTPALQQVANVACLPGIQTASLAMADIHPGYGFAIGGVGAFDMETGVISVAGVGFDINCGVRVLLTPLYRDDVEPKKTELANQLFRDVPSGVGSTGDIRLKEHEIDELLVKEEPLGIEVGRRFVEPEVAGPRCRTVAERVGVHVVQRGDRRGAAQLGRCRPAGERRVAVGVAGIAGAIDAVDDDRVHRLGRRVTRVTARHEGDRGARGDPDRVQRAGPVVAVAQAEALPAKERSG